MTHPQDKGNEGLSLREQLIQEAEAAHKGFLRIPTDVGYSTETTALGESHARLLAFIKGQKDDAYDNGEGFCVVAYTDPETLLP